MFVKARAPAETLATVRTLIGFLSRVDPLMSVEVRPLNKAFLAGGTFVGFLSGVDFLVVAQS